MTITMIIPMFNYLKTKVLNNNPSDSNFIQTMKSHMKTKLDNRYSDAQEKILKTIKKIDPRYKSRVQALVCQGHLRQTITKFVRASEDDYIEPTEGQELQHLSNFTTPRSSARDRPGLSPEEEMLNSLLTGDDEDSQVIHTSLREQIDIEVNYYSQLRFTDTDKKGMDVLKWWKENKNRYPCLYEAAKGLLHTPATSVPSKRIFSEAGYIARARRSRILPVNLNRHLFIKKNLKYVPTYVDNSTQEIAASSLQENVAMPEYFPNID